MKFNFRKSMYLCASALMMLSLTAPAANASQTTKDNNQKAPATVKPANNLVSSKSNKATQNATTHQDDEAKINSLKQTHAANVKKFDRIKQHVQTHQQNLQKLAKKLNKANKNGKSAKEGRRHAKNVALLNRLSGNKTKLINAIKSDQKGMLHLAKLVHSEEHQINLVNNSDSNDVTTTRHNDVTMNVANNDNSDNNVNNDNHTHFVIVNGHHHHHFARHHLAKMNHRRGRNRKHVYIHNHNGKITGQVVINGKTYPLTNSEYKQAKNQMNGFKSLGYRINNFSKRLNHELKADLRM